MHKQSLIYPLMAAYLLLGCQLQPAVNRVQPNVTLKSDLLGAEWYFQQTVVDTPYATDFTFVGESGQLERIEWEIQEEFLVARRSYEFVAGSDPQGINGTTDTASAPVAMYRIDRHFDIRRQYNPVTGEELNVIEENTMDRPWHERDYIRVDWSQNLVTDPNFFMLQRYFNGIQMEPVAWFVQDGPNAPRFERTTEDGPIEYMEITNKMFVRPTEANIPGFGPIASCFMFQWFDGNPVDCAASEVTVRNSFVRIDPTHDYEPEVYTGDRMDLFGYFVTERAGYDAAYGLVEPERYRFINRHNLWQQSHRRDADNEWVTCTTNGDCDDGRGSRCDLDWGRARRLLTDDRRVQGVCTIPYRDREARPIVYHATENYPEDLLPELQLISGQWNGPFADTVASLRENECRATGGSNCAAERERDDAQQMFVVCQSPVPENAPAACGRPGTIARIGDLRYSLVGWVNEPHRSSPLGYGPSAADPLTGEIVSGTAFLYGAGVDTLTAFGRDIVRLLNGDITEADIRSGAPVEAWLQGISRRSEEGGASRAAHNHVIPVDGENVERIDAAMDFSWIPHHAHAHDRGNPANPAEMVERLDTGLTRLRNSGALGDGVDRAQARLSRLVGTDIEAMMTTPDMQLMAGIDPNSPLDDSVMAAASPLRGMSLAQREALDRARVRMQESAGIDYGEFGDEGLLGLARAIARAAQDGEGITWNGVTYNVRDASGQIDYDAVRDMLRHPIMSGLALHEVGHTIGLRHNFEGSYDALNYHSEYWDLRDDGNMAPRAWDPMTNAEHDGRIMEYAYSTVMDYGHNFVASDAHGIGHYDSAAIKMGYGDLVEVFTDVNDDQELAWRIWFGNLGWPVPLTFDWATGRGDIASYSYTDWPRLAGGRQNLQGRANVPYTSLTTHPFLASNGFNDPIADNQGRLMVPYRFCSDEQADLGPTCQRYDAGADQYETLQSVVDNYWNYYVFNNFRRYRIGFNVNSVANRVYGRYFRRFQRANQQYALYRAVYQDVFGDSSGFDTFFTRQNGMGAYTAGVGAAYQTLSRVIAAPEPGNYGRATRGDGTTALMSGGDEVSINGFDGRYLETTWDFSAGYYWFDQLNRVGYFYDKILAIMTLTDPTTYFLGRDTDADIRRFQLSFATTFGPSLTRLMSGVLGEDWRAFAPRVTGDGSLVYPDPLEIEMGSMGGTPLTPNASFSIQLYAAVYAMAMIPETYDQDFLNRSRIWIRGGAEEVDVAPGTATVTFTDEASGLTYEAVSYDDGSVEQGVGAQLINHANQLAARAATSGVAASELRSFVDNLDLMRRLTWQLGFGAQP